MTLLLASWFNLVLLEESDGITRLIYLLYYPGWALCAHPFTPTHGVCFPSSYPP